jgi:hypothetical protein
MSDDGGGSGDDDDGHNGDGEGAPRGRAVEVYFPEYDSWRPATVLGHDEDELIVVQYDDGEVGACRSVALRACLVACFAALRRGLWRRCRDAQTHSDGRG